MSTFFGHNPFPSGDSTPICDFVTPAVSGNLLRCPQTDGCDTCDINIDDTKFLNCYISSFNSRLGLGATESTVTVELIEPVQLDCGLIDNCIAEDGASTNGICVYVSTREITGAADKQDCLNLGNTVWICGSGLNNYETDIRYSGRIGYIYSLKLGKFYFRGILSNHQYRESDGGYRYSVTLTDGRQALNNVKVILNGFYDDIPDSIKPNIINAIYELEPSVTDDDCGSGYKCRDFVNSTNSTRGMLFIKALQAINGKYIQVPVSEACLQIDVSKIIDICSEQIRTSSSDMSVLELISTSCEESGYTFYIAIEGNSIVAYPINQKDPVTTSDLFNFMNSFNSADIIIDRNYGEELTYEKSKKFIVGDNYRYLLVIDTPAGFLPTVPATVQCGPGNINLPGSGAYISQNANYTSTGTLGIEDIVQEPALEAPITPTCTPVPGL